MSTTVACNRCGDALDEDPGAPLADRRPCPRCGGIGRNVFKTLEAMERADAYFVARVNRTGADRSLPEKGVIRSEGGTRTGRDGRRVHREALYDPYADDAKERVVDAETGEVIVDKEESMKAKYLRRGRWRPKP